MAINFLSKLSPETKPPPFHKVSRYIKIQPKPIYLSMRLYGVYSPEPRTEVYCVRLNFNISKLVYWLL